MRPYDGNVQGRSVTTQGSATLLGGLLYIVAVAQYFIAQLYVAKAWNPPYDWFNDYISDLGNTACAMFAVPHGTQAYVCSPRHAVMNGAFVASGALLVVGTAALWRFWPTGRTIRSALMLLMLSGCGKMLVGWVPENENFVVHSIAAFNIPVESLAILLISVATFQQWSALGFIGFGAFLLGIVGTALSVAAQFAGADLLFDWSAGGMERLAGYPANAWLVAAGFTAFGEAPGLHRL